MRKIAIALLLAFSLFSVSASADHLAYCDEREFVCYGGGADGLPCTNNDDCRYPVQTLEPVTDESDVLYAEVVLGLMGVAIAALITIVGFTIYAHGASKKPARKARKPARRTAKAKKRRR